jgi:glycosyltransferase involved in cell wall biosynthesis
MKFSLVIPTYKRPDALGKAVRAILEGVIVPDELLIIDDDTLEENFCVTLSQMCKKRGVPMVYHNKIKAGLRRGLSESKNWAAQLASHEIVCYIDDDVVVDSRYFEKLMEVWVEHKDDARLWGVGGRIENTRHRSWFEKKVFNHIFGLSSEYGWDVTNVGFQVWNDEGKEKEKGYYMHGGVSSYRRSVLVEFSFATFSGGRTGLEDVDHAFRLKRAGHYAMYMPQATVVHEHVSQGREQSYVSGMKESWNRKEIFRNHCRRDMFQYIWFAWSNIGWILKKMLSGDIRYTWGMTKGFLGSIK